jgi:hypothetical protein
MNIKYESLPLSELEKINSFLSVIKECFYGNAEETTFSIEGKEIPVFKLDIREKKFTDSKPGTDVKDVEGFLHNRMRAEGLVLKCDNLAPRDGAYAYTLTLPEDFIDKCEKFKAKISAFLVTKEDSKVIYENGILKFMQKEINFNNKQNQKDLLRTLFEEPKKNWSYDEIQEDWDETGIDKEKYPKDYWRKFYSAGDDISESIAIKTQIEDFIIKNTKEIRINPKYV